MSFLVDANVLSEPTKPEPDLRVVDWLSHHERDLVVDPIILGEIQYGILLLPRSKRRQRLEAWFSAGIERIHCLGWEAATGLRWARLIADLRAEGRSMPIKDSWIAATALHHEIPLVTRNRKDFEPAGVEIIDPFA